MKLNLKIFLLPESNLEFPQHPVVVFFFFLSLGDKSGGSISQQMSFIPVFPKLSVSYTHNCFLI